MGIADRLSALGRGAAQSATGGWVDEGFAKIMDYLPRPDDGGVPREYAGGAQEQYLRSARADDAEAARKYPANYGTGQLLGAVPAAVATAPLGVPGMVGLGAAQAAGSSENTGMALARDAVRGGALGGALGAAGNVAQAAAPAAKAALDKLRQGPPPGLQPALATAGAEAAPVARAARPELGGPQINKSQGFDPSKFEKGFDRFGQDSAIRAEPTVVPRKASPPPRPNTADLAENTPSSGSLAEEERFAQRAIDGRISSPPAAPNSLPRPAKVPTFDEADLVATEKALRNKEAEWAAAHQKRFGESAKIQTGNKTIKPPRGKRPAQKPAPEQSAQIVPIKQAAPAPRPELTAANKPLVGPKQLSDDRILELARQTPESAPQPRAEMSPEQMESAKQALRDQFRKTASGGNVVGLDDGSMQVADNPFVAGTVREYQQNAKAALAAGDEDAAAWFKDKIESLLSAGGE